MDSYLHFLGMLLLVVALNLQGRWIFRELQSLRRAFWRAHVTTMSPLWLHAYCDGLERECSKDEINAAVRYANDEVTKSVRSEVGE